MACLHAALAFFALSANPGQTVLLDFSATYCQPCREMAPTVRKLAALGYPVRPVDVQQEPALAAKFGVHRIPCFVMVVDGREVDRQLGLTSLAGWSRCVALVPGHRDRSLGVGRRKQYGHWRTGPPAGSSGQTPDVCGRVAAQQSTRAGPRCGAFGQHRPAAGRRRGWALLRLGNDHWRPARRGPDPHLRTHLPRLQGKGRIEIDMFGPQPASRAGPVDSYDLKCDMGLV